MGYNFYGFNPLDFEELVQALFQRLLGNSSLVYGIGADGGRELSFLGRASFASPQEFHEGLWIVQAKFRSRGGVIQLDHFLPRRQFVQPVTKKSLQAQQNREAQDQN
ncbi:hypothetical protein SNE25_19625 [Mucilaginibacter sabulilitoris]|uniref:Uncharacterized protein n=1 Tax=Mucilaginibacter sabulilitoris TaxID=1173583 RepID=A0ABZ0TEA6_9SPHI|nr:hypothetical protein [Mucilaginibacter sabulilitoris]WPU91532.1 hypothetical protein SNE25_19625 [Mucilaginibacter sabulilitoris]